MIHYMRNLILVTVCNVAICGGWKAIPANQAMYSMRAATSDKLVGRIIPVTGDEELPRDNLNFIYKFGQCEPGVAIPQFLRKTVNFTLATWQSQQSSYLYLLAKKHTINHEMQCIVMKTFVAAKFLFFRGRFPLYYCQGIVYTIMLNTIHRYEIHEFYLHQRLNVPVSFTFEFYHPIAAP